MKKITTLSFLLFAATFLAGCTSKTQIKTQAPAVQQPAKSEVVKNNTFSTTFSTESLQITKDIPSIASCLDEHNDKDFPSDSFEPGTVLIYFYHGASTDEMNLFLKSINSEQKITPSDEIPILEVQATYSKGGEKPTDWPKYEEKVRNLAEIIKIEYEEVESYEIECCGFGYPWINFYFKKPINQESYKKIEQSLRKHPEVGEIHASPDTFYLKYLSVDPDLGQFQLKVPVGREKEFMCKINAMEDPAVERTHLNIATSFN